jgi:hypothetical protein
MDQFAAIIATAKTRLNMTSAEFDESLASGDGRAVSAIVDACYSHANPTVVNANTTDQELSERQQRARDLHTALRPQIAQRITEARNRSYTGWADASCGPIRYA